MNIDLDTEFLLELYRDYQLKYNKIRNLKEKIQPEVGPIRNTRRLYKEDKVKKNYINFNKALVNSGLIKSQSGPRGEGMPRRRKVNANGKRIRI